MLHAGIAPPGADQFVERVVGAGRAELLAVTRAEAAHRVLIEQDLADRPQCRLVELPGRPLGQRVEAANRFERVAKEVEAQRLCRPRGEEVDDAAADGEFAGLAHRIGADVAIVAEKALQPVETDATAGPQRQDAAVEEPARRHALDQRVDRGQHDQLCRAGGREPGQGVDPPADDFAVWRDAVVG